MIRSKKPLFGAALWWLLCALVCVTLVLPISTHAAEDSAKETLYLRATQLYQKRQYQQAAPLLRKILPLFAKAQQGQVRGSRGWHQLTLAQIDINARLATIAWKSGRKRRACRKYAWVDGAVKTLPSAWKTWTAHTALPGLVQSSLQRLQRDCTSVPSVILVQVKPPQARLLYRKEGQWKALSGRTLTTSKGSVSLRVMAPGYQTKTLLNRQVPRWRQVTWTVTLQREVPTLRRATPVARRQPASRRSTVAVVRRPTLPRRLPPPVVTPFYKTWWFWTVTGVVVAGGTTAAILAVTMQPDFVLQGASKGEPHKIW